MNKYWNYNINK